MESWAAGTHSQPLRIRSFSPFPRPVMAAFPPSAMVMAVKSADFPPAVSSKSCINRKAESRSGRLTPIVTNEKVHLRAEVDGRMRVIHEVDNGKRLDDTRIRRSLISARLQQTFSRRCTHAKLLHALLLRLSTVVSLQVALIIL